MPAPEQSLKTGEVAALAGVNVQTLRYYERRGILPRPPRRPSGYRQYGPDAVRIVRFVKRAQELGFTLREAQALLRLRADTRRSCDQVRRVALGHMAQIEQRLSSLGAMKQALALLITTCKREGSARRCPIIEALVGD